MSQTYFLTGALGCIGAWVVKTIQDRGDRAVVFDLGGDRRRILDLLDEDQAAGVAFVQGDITDAGAVRDAMESHDARRIIHLAGLQVPFCKADPALGARVNVVGTVNVFEAARTLEIDRVVYASSAAVYGPPEDEGGPAPDESAACEPTTHYGVYKRANEGNARIYWQDNGISSVGLRPLTVYGVGRDQGLTSGPTVAMKAASLGRSYTISFSGATDFNYVADTASAFVECADRGPEGASVFNLHGDSVAVSEIVEAIHATLPADAPRSIDFAGPPLPIPPALDGQALYAALPGLQRTPLEDGIRSTIEHFTRLADAGRLDTRDLDG